MVSAGYGVLAPDLLGYGETDAPHELEPYAFVRMADDMAALLRECGIYSDSDTTGGKVHVVGHDFGGVFMGTFVAYYPQPVRTAVTISVALYPLGEKLDLDK